MPKWVAGLELWSDGRLGQAGGPIAGLPLSALPAEGRWPLRQQAVPTVEPAWPHPPRQRANPQVKPDPPAPQPLARGTPGPPPKDQSQGTGSGEQLQPHWDGPGKVDEEAKGLVLGPGLIARMGGSNPTAKRLAAAYWRAHGKPAGKDCYGAPDPSQANQGSKSAAGKGGCGGGSDPWAKNPAGRDEDLQKALSDKQRLERQVADLQRKLGAYASGEAAERICQRGEWSQGPGHGGAGAHQDGAGPGQAADELSTMS